MINSEKFPVTRVVVTKEYWDALAEEQQKKMREDYNGYPGMFILFVEGTDDRTHTEKDI